MAAREEFVEALEATVLAGRSKEDRSQGHSLFEDPTTRAVQERFPALAERDRALLVRVLRESSDATHRAFAAQLLGCVSDKRTVVDDLVYGTSEPDQNVRNDAMRALFVFAATEPGPGRIVPEVPWEPFVALLESEFHTDRNKASRALLELSDRRDPRLLAALRTRALVPLAEMALPFRE